MVVSIFIFTVIDRTCKWMEAIPLSDTSAASCAKALVFSSFGMPKRSLPIVGHNLLQIFGHCFVKCYTFRVAKQQLIILSRTVRSNSAPMLSCGVDPSPSPSGSGPGTRSSPSATSRPAWKRTPCVAVRDAAADCWASAKAVLPPPSISRFQTRWILHLLLPMHCQPMVQELFFWSRTSFLHTLDQRRHPCLHSTGTRTVSGAVSASKIGPLTSPPASRRQSSDRARWRRAIHPWLTVKPVGLVPKHPCTQCTVLYISCYVLSNTVVLLYLLLCLLPQ